MKKIFIFMLCIFTCLFSINVNADEVEKGKITIANAVIDETYSIYKMFDLESYNKETGAYAYKIIEDWRNFFTVTTSAGYQYVDIDEDGYITANKLTDSTVAAFAKDALAYAKANSISPINSDIATTTTVVFDNLDLGYYLVDTTLGTLCMLNTTDNTITINEKNIIPTVDNTAKEGTAYATSSDAELGTNVDFKATINAYKGAENYVFHAQLDDGLTLDPDSINVTGLTAGTDYTVKTSDIGDDTFQIVFAQNYLDTITGTTDDPTEIEVTYTATLNNGAVIGGDGNKSSTYLTYDETGSQTSTTDVAIVYTWDTDFYKFYKDEDEEKQPLADAVFVISRTNLATGAIELVSLGGNVYRVATSEDSSKITTITTDSTGEFTIEGLDSQQYYLIETVAPEGYNKLSTPATFTIVSTTDTTTGEMTAVTKVSNVTVTEVEIENKNGAILPATGGMGTKLLISVGSMLFLSTMIVLVTKKRMYNAS